MPRRLTRDGQPLAKHRKPRRPYRRLTTREAARKRYLDRCRTAGVAPQPIKTWEAQWLSLP
ncbi:MAG: hypothetical protein RLZZ524_2922 [Pseudomonadota bacterium]|jgi:hypothetical protein